MKTIYIIGGTMGVGKTTVCQKLKKMLDNSVFLDGDWCWDADPFVVTDETKAMVMDNIHHTLNNFIKCSAYQNIIFCWVMHMQSIIDDVINGLEKDNCRIVSVSLMAAEENIRDRLGKDIKNGIRTEDVLERSVARIPLYELLNSTKIYTDDKTVEEIAIEIMNI